MVYLGRPPLAYIAATLTSPDLIWIGHPFSERDHEALIKKINNKRIILLTRTTPEDIDDAKSNLGLLGLNVSDTCSNFYTNLGGPFLLCPLLRKDDLYPMAIPNDTSEWQFEIMPELRKISLRSGESPWLSVSLRNSGHSKFLANFPETLILMGYPSIGQLDGEMNISYHIFDGKNTLLLWDGFRTRIPKSLSPGESVVFRVRIVAPHEKGLYRIRFNVVQEGVTWFSNRIHTEDLILNVY